MTSFSGSFVPQYTKQPIVAYFTVAQAALHPPVAEQSQPIAPNQTAAPSSALVKKRGIEGGKGANWGEARLIDIVLSLLKKNTLRVKCDNILHLYKEHEILFVQAFENYKKELKDRKRYGNKGLTYGQSLTVDGMYRKLKQWVKKPYFLARLIELGYL